MTTILRHVAMLTDEPSVTGDAKTELAAGVEQKLAIVAADGPSRVLVIGALSSVTPTTGASTGVAGAGTSPSSLVKPTGAADWTVDDLNGKWLHVTGGGGYLSGPPLLRPIIDTSGTSLTVEAVSGMDSTTTFAIVDLATTISLSAVIKRCGCDVYLSAVRFECPVAITDSGRVTLDGCSFVGSATSVSDVSEITVSNCQASQSATLTVADCGSVELNGTLNASDAGQISVVDCRRMAGSGLTLTSDDSIPLDVRRIQYLTLEADSSACAGVGVHLEDIQRCVMSGSGLTGSGNGTFGLRIAGTGHYSLTGSTITGDSGDVSFLGRTVSWAVLSSPSYGIAEEHAASAVANASYTKSVKYGSYLYDGNIDVSGRLLCYGYLNQATKLSGITAAGTDAATATDLGAEGALSFAEVSTVASGTGVRLPANAAIAGHVVTVYNSGANTLAIYPPSGGAIDGGVSVTLDTGKVSSFASLNGAAGKNFVRISGT